MNDKNSQPRFSGKQKAGGFMAAMLLIATPFVAQWEGKRNNPYIDAVGVKTVCYGETRVDMRQYSDEECLELLEAGLKEFASGVKDAAPGIEKHPYMWASHTSFAYNVGMGAYRKSSVRRLYNQGKYRASCNFMKRYKYGGGRVLAGLVYRRSGDGKRIGEAEICLVDAVKAELERA